jgi:hypothetical protein
MTALELNRPLESHPARSFPDEIPASQAVALTVSYVLGRRAGSINDLPQVSDDQVLWLTMAQLPWKLILTMSDAEAPVESVTVN